MGGRNGRVQGGCPSELSSAGHCWIRPTAGLLYIHMRGNMQSPHSRRMRLERTQCVNHRSCDVAMTGSLSGETCIWSVVDLLCEKRDSRIRTTDTQDRAQQGSHG